MAVVKDPYGREVDPVAFEGDSSIKRLILNRPSKLNSITYRMVTEMTNKLKEYEKDPAVKLVIMKGNGKHFCAGGDLLSYYTYMREGQWPFGALYYRKQLVLNHLLATYKKPLVALIDGLVMGAGVGLSIHAPYRIVTENTMLAMPEAAIGYFPDVGASYFLSRLPGYFGEYLGLTGVKLSGAGMLACGLATHFVHSKDIQVLEKALDEVTVPDITSISGLVNNFSNEKNSKQNHIFQHRLKIINKCFSEKTVESILLSLEKELEKGEQKWIVGAIKSMKSACPTSLKIFLRSVREGRYMNIEQCLSREYIIAHHVGRGSINDNFLKGLNSMLVHKNKIPKWEPPKLEQVTEEIVDKYFADVDDEDWEPLQLPPRSRPLIDGSSSSSITSKL